MWFLRAMSLFHDLGLDAALVAVIWQMLLVRSFGAGCSAPFTAVLFFAVWGIYLGDRLWDARVRGELKTRRHRFARRHGCLIGVLAATSFLVAICFAVMVATPSFCIAGGAVGGLCAGYYAARFAFPGWEHGRAGIVGGLFAAGTLLPVALELGFQFVLCGALLAMGALFTANVRICIWSEAGSCGAPLRLAIGLPLVAAGVGFAFLAVEACFPIALAGFSSIAGLFLLARNADTIEGEALAARADAALLIPAAVPLTVLLLKFGW